MLEKKTTKGQIGINVNIIRASPMSYFVRTEIIVSYTLEHYKNRKRRRLEKKNFFTFISSFYTFCLPWPSIPTICSLLYNHIKRSTH